MADHLEILVEEISMEVFLSELLPNMIGGNKSYAIHSFQGKNDLLKNLAARLQGYSLWLPDNWRILVVVDRDDDDCRKLKKKLERIAFGAGLVTKSKDGSGVWKLVNRISIEELEAWYFGDWVAVKDAYPRVSEAIPRKAQCRLPDEIHGGTWEAFERVMKKSGDFRTGLRKTEAARSIGRQIIPERNSSHSFQMFASAILAAFKD
jgi:hypothetical protein